MSFSIAMDWHDGERKMHELMRVPDHDNPTATMLTPQAANMLVRAPLIALGTLDAEQRPWATIWGGEPPMSQPLGQGLIGIRTRVDREYDPVVEALFGAKQQGKDDGEVVRAEGAGKMVAGLPIDLVTRKRVKFYGRMAAGAVEEGQPLEEGEVAVGPGSAQLVIRVDQSLGNCPKYLNQRTITPASTRAELISNTPNLSADALALVTRSDLFFVASSNADRDMDTNHRGGPPGFVRSYESESGETHIVWPEYSGNRLYQTLGNLQSTPRAGLVFPDFESGDVLYVSGTTQILVGKDADALQPHSNLVVSLKVEAARHVRSGLAFRGQLGDRSPYNPRVRPLRAENLALGVTGKDSVDGNSARLVAITSLAPSITRYTFRLERPVDRPWLPGGFVALDFSKELDEGYSHMRDEDPRSINDDFVRTFTVSSAPISLPQDHSKQSGHAGPADTNREFDITVRDVGVVTKFLTRQSIGLELPVQGFGGDFTIDITSINDRSPVKFIAGGVGITPLLAQLATNLDPNRTRLWWTVRFVDLPLVNHVLDKYRALGNGLSLFVTGSNGTDQSQAEVLSPARDLATTCELRRMQREDLKLDEEAMKSSDDSQTGQSNATTWYICASTPLRKQILIWLEEAGKTAVYEDFDF